MGAVALGLGATGLAEGTLGLAGVEPLQTARPQFYSHRMDAQDPLPQVFAPVGTDWTTLEEGDARFQVFARVPTKPRLVVLGESSAHGSNHLIEEAFAGRLAQSLDVDVINAGMGGAISDEIVAVGEQSLDQRPDALLLYFGYNDLNRLVDVVRLGAFSPSRLRLRNALDRSRLVRVLSEVVPDAWLQVAPEEAFDAVPGDGLPDGYLADVRALARGHASRNMGRLIRQAEDGQIALRDGLLAGLVGFSVGLREGVHREIVAPGEPLANSKAGGSGVTIDENLRLRHDGGDPSRSPAWVRLRRVAPSQRERGHVTIGS